MSSITIRAKLFGLAVLGVIIFMVVIGIYWYTQSVSNEASLEKERVQKVEIAVGRVMTGLLQARRAEKDFLLRNTNKYINRHKEIMSNNYGLIDELDKVIENDQGKQRVNELEKRFKNYEDSFQRMVKLKVKVGLDEKSGLLGGLRKSVHNVEDRLKKYNKLEMMLSMLMMRRHEKDYLARGTDKYLDKMKNQMLTFSALLKKADLSANQQATVSQLMSSYQKDFFALADGMNMVKSEIAIFREEAHAIDPIVTSIQKMMEDLNRADGEFQSIQDRQISQLNTLMTVTILLGGGILVFVLIFIARGIIVRINNAVRLCERIAAGDLTTNIIVNSNDEIGRLQQALKTMSDKLNGMMAQVDDVSASIVTGSQQISAANINLSQRTEEQASSLEETASSMEEMTSTVRQNADSAQQANQLATAAREQAVNGSNMVQKTVVAMGEISESSNRIADIISTIDGIAFQTNLLALNAAVEAARAGEQGRGFAVVASEVRNLAGRSAEAAKEIKQLIEDSVSKVDVGTKLTDESGKTLNDIMESIKKVADIVAEITDASEEQSSGINQVNKAITQMDEMTQQNASMVEEAAAASRAMEDQALQLKNLISFFNLKDTAINAASSSRNTSGHVALEKKPVVSMPISKRMAKSESTHVRRNAVKSEEEWADF